MSLLKVVEHAQPPLHTTSIIKPKCLSFKTPNNFYKAVTVVNDKLLRFELKTAREIWRIS